MHGGHPHSLDPRQARRVETQRVTLIGAVINLLLALGKIVGGLVAQSQALIADGIHSLSDLVSDGLIWWAAHHAAQEPDAEHPYGHGRFETAATLGLGALLVLVAGGIVLDAAERMFETERLWQPQVAALYIAAISVLSKEALYWYTVIVARRIKSEMLKANAWHHRSDAVSSVVVVVGVGGTLLGYYWLDALAAVVVGLMVAKVGWDLGWGAMQELVDSALEEDKVEEIRDIIKDVDGVRSVHMLRTRRQGHEALADVHVQVEPWLSVSEGHMISMAVEQRIKADVDEITDVTVHIDPEDDEEAPPCAGLPLRDEALGQLRSIWADLDCADRIQRIMLHYLSGRIDVEVYFPLDCATDADSVSILQRDLQERLRSRPNFGRVRLFFSQAPI